MKKFTEAEARWLEDWEHGQIRLMTRRRFDVTDVDFRPTDIVWDMEEGTRKQFIQDAVDAMFSLAGWDSEWSLDHPSWIDQKTAEDLEYDVLIAHSARQKAAYKERWRNMGKKS